VAVSQRTSRLCSADSDNAQMDPLCSLHYYAPICAIINACFVPFTEGWAPFIAFPKIGFFIMGLNALNAFLLNVAAVFLIGAAGGLVLTLGEFDNSSSPRRLDS